MTTALLSFLAGIGLLLISSSIFVRFLVQLSRALRISPLIIGTTIAAVGTSMPELAISAIASIQGDVGLATGNIVGSNTVNVLLILAIGILLGRIRIGTTKTQRNNLILLATSMLFLFLAASTILPPRIGVVLLVGAGFFTLVEYHWGVDGRTKEDAAWNHQFHRTRIRPHSLFAIGLTLSGIFIGGRLAVSSIEEIANATGIATSVLGLSLTAVATSLPELLVTITSFRQHQEKLLIGTILGSNIYNLLLIGGTIGLFSPFQLDYGWTMFSIATMLFSIIIFTFGGKTIPKRVGGGLLLVFALYLLTIRSIN